MTKQKPLKPKRDIKSEIIQAAYRVLAEQGYDAASVKEIARTAGVSPGHIHYYFESKDALLLAVLAEASRAYHARVRSWNLPDDVQAAAHAAFRAQAESVEREPEWYRLRYELFAMGLRNPQLRPAVAELLAFARNGIGQVVAHVSALSEDERKATASILLACFDGLALQKLTDPNFNLEGAFAMLERMAGAITQKE